MARVIREKSDRKPWYREPGPWLIMMGPAIVVVGSLFCVYLAFSREDDLVTQNYYQEGQNINQRMHEDEKAKALGLDGKLTLDLAKGHIDLVLDNPHNQELPPVLQMDLAHPTQEKLDQHVLLSKVDSTHYLANIEPTSATRWHISIQNQDMWRMEGEWDAKSGNTVHVVPTAAGDTAKPAEG